MFQNEHTLLQALCSAPGLNVTGSLVVNHAYASSVAKTEPKKNNSSSGLTSSTLALSRFMMQLRKEPAPSPPAPPRQPGFRLFHNYCWTAWVSFDPFWLTQLLAGIVAMATFVASKEPQSKHVSPLLLPGSKVSRTHCALAKPPDKREDTASFGEKC